jgi:hypothetical protein
LLGLLQRRHGDQCNHCAERNRKVATNVLKALGADVTIRYVTSGAYNTTTGLSGETVSDVNVKGVVEGVSKSEVNGLIQAQDKRLIVSAEEVGTAPGTKDRVVILSVVYQIISVNTIEQDNTAITYELILRG